MSEKRIDWEKLWRRFNRYYSFHSWNEQQDKIQELVEKQLKAKRKK